MTNSHSKDDAGHTGPHHTIRNGCRIILFCACSRLQAWGSESASLFEGLIEAGDIASVVFYVDGQEQVEVQSLLEPLCGPLQAAGVAVIIDGDTRTAGRIGADGLQVNAEATLLQSVKEQHGGQMMVGVTNVKGRHNALLLGEGEPDYLMFGKPGTDTRPEPHPKNIDLGNWWSSMVEIPCIVLGGSDLSSALDVAKSGVEFVGLETAIFGDEEDALTREQVIDRLRQTNQLLDDHAPQFDLAD